MKYLFSITLTLLLVRAHTQPAVQYQDLPEVFLIGEHETHYFELSQQYPEVFMNVYDNNIDKAYRAWTEFAMDIEDYATDIQFDIKGAKLWINIYFSPDGSIAHLAFFPKPNSRNIPEEHLVAFFKGFVRQHKFVTKNEQGFQHSTSISFPTFFHRTAPLTAKGN